LWCLQDPSRPHSTRPTRGLATFRLAPPFPITSLAGFVGLLVSWERQGGATRNVAAPLVGAVGGVERWELDMPVTASCIFLRFFGNLSFRGYFLLCPLCLFCVMPLPWHLIPVVVQLLTTGKEAITRKAKTWDSLFPVLLIVSGTLYTITCCCAGLGEE